MAFQAYATRLLHFAESEEVSSLVAALPEACREMRAREISEQRFTGWKHWGLGAFQLAPQFRIQVCDFNVLLCSYLG